MAATPDWSGAGGDIWAERWRDTDRALSEIGAALDRAIRAAAPAKPFTALDIGCGPGTTALALAAARPDATVLGCDLSHALVAVARERTAGNPSLSFTAEDAEQAARDHGPFDLLISRHGVMFFDDPRRAFTTFRAATTAGGALVFSCFQSWERNAWAAEIASAAAGKPLPPPGREPSGFAFADPEYVGELLRGAGWTPADPEPLAFDYVAGEGQAATDQALDFFSVIGPAARAMEAMDAPARGAALDRMRTVIAEHNDGDRVTFPAAAWIWTARAQ
ncbi:class I SAM-dependent methyltransferase [Sphingomonas sp.]|uniref:class I SAM-dependent methyltransferase n=1 Tax=Sphingomonas sp. TaxID=28214 RepID=UPI00286E5748|nr:class I SAM-dependent methyltransferase [Sphingomonas sp.]